MGTLLDDVVGEMYVQLSWDEFTVFNDELAALELFHGVGGWRAAADALDAQARLHENSNEWDRKTLADVPTEIIATVMHKAIGNQTPFETVRTIADAITDTSTEPRTFDCGSSCAVLVTANAVRVVQS